MRIVVPFSAGALTDIIARIYVEKLQGMLGQAVVVDSRPGASGITASQDILQSLADGHAMLFVSSAHAVNPALRSKLPYDTEKPLFQTLSLQVADHIGARIIDGSYASGSRLREIKLAEGFDVSRATIREALRLLEQRGLVGILPQRGAHVTQLSANELDDLFEVRASLLATGSRLAAERCTERMARTLRSMLERLRQSVDDVDAYTRASADLVRIMVEISGNEVLASYIDDFAMRIGRYTRMGLISPGRRRRSVANWARLINAVMRRDGAAAAKHHAQLALENRSAAMDAFQKQAQPRQVRRPADRTAAAYA